TLYRTVLPSEFVELAAKHGVVGTVVVEASPWLEDNQWILDLAKDNPIIVGFVGNLPVGTPEFAALLKRFSANPLFRGIRLNSGAVAKGLGQEAFENDLKLLGNGGFSLDLLGGAAMLPNVVRVAKLAPNLRIVIDHLPFKDWDRDPSAMRRALNEAAACPNIHAKVSEVVRRADGKVVEDASFYRPGLDALWELFGPDRVIYGSNWPVSNLVAPYESVYQVVSDYVRTKGQEEAEKYFWRNSLTVYRWQPRGLAAGLLK
ncbi:MAG: amidohydrolase family protein, partial [Opitutaceae bacterium]|nr:amidohydrolase family protein [Verrucomicrobiales bacterium]